jgi:predicted permease
MRDLWQDLRFGLRMLAKTPGFTAVAVLSLALGIGANTAIFSLVDAVLIRPLNFKEPDRLAMVWEDASEDGFPRNTPAPANYVDWKSQNHTFEDIAALDTGTFSLTGDGEPEKIDAQEVTADFFPMLGVKPLLGRFFLPEEDRPGGNKVAILSYGLWQRRFGGDVSLLGKDIVLNDQKTTVVGIMPAGFQFLARYIGLWVPKAFTPHDLATRGAHYLVVIGRLKPGISVAAANIDIKTITEGIARDHPDQAKDLRANVFSMRDQLTGEVRPALMMMLAAVAFVLLIACANLANLQLSRAAERNKEIAVRSALGASRWRLARQLLTENLLLSVMGAALGLLLAHWSFQFLKELVPATMALSANLGINNQVFSFTLLVSGFAGVLFGLAPARQAGRIDLSEALKQGTGRGHIGPHRGLRRLLVVSEVALSVMLLIGAGLLIQTFVNLRKLDLGFHPGNVLSVRTKLPFSKYGASSKRASFYSDVLERVSKVPGAASAAYSTAAPLTWKGGANGFVVEGRPEEQFSRDALIRQISPDYFSALGATVRWGRVFNQYDGADTMPVGIINQTMADQFWHGEDPMGRRFGLDVDPGENVKWVTVVGIVADINEMGLQAPHKAEMYFPYQQIDQAWNAPRDLLTRSDGDPMRLVPAIRSAVWSVDAAQPVSNVQTLDEIVGEEVVQQRLGMTLLAVFAGLALLLAGIGLYGVLAYAVTQRTQEIGVRMALGATPGRVLGMVMADAMSMSAIGIAAGLAASSALTRLMASLVFGVNVRDPLTFAAVPVLIGLVSLAASYIPARRATKVDPITAVRYE